MSRSDPLSSEAVSQDLGTHIVGSRVLYYPSLTSTMDVARQEALSTAAEGTVIIADEQTAGRGRLKRSWLTPTGNLALSVVLSPRVSELPSLIMVASLAVVHSIAAVTGIKTGIKWPNDVLINNKKVCGILIETDARPLRGGRANYAIIGIGINVNFRPADYPEIQSLATSLMQEVGIHVSRLALIRTLLRELDRLYLDLKSGISPYEEWRNNLVMLGQNVKVTDTDGVVEGLAESVVEDSSLLIRLKDGSTRRIVAGDITFKV
jgi:BirA family biotin operon repressor/biotin-[acetyl-CoA-carboxylase] ligase